MVDSGARRVVTVPDVVGLPFHVGRDVAADAGVALASTDPDGPPIGSLAWPGLFSIVSQHPAPGAQVREWDSVAIEVVAHGDAGDREQREPHPSPPADAARATPERPQHLDLTDD
ncbi:PASTA domain-containing protein [Galbitalea sp. SE-J8]|uniref:PASTA domain-containing protein n=1 Tax=Galbitalea sp. SE-J8 TaxID=3054952 RepID=UPI00259C751D|nr:PASTA domain-containing protein [Galbitalea sp. SE-J8]MDM4763217.1 PASTA domain-containing protein [Galbitalea sp. SE-J8]